MQKLLTSILGALLLLRSPVHTHPSSRRRIVGGHLALSLLILIVSSLATAAPASAAVPGLVRVETSTLFSSIDNKTIVANCPSGTFVHGAGGTVQGGDGDVIITEILPVLGLESVQVNAVEDVPLSTTWKLTAIAMCAPPVPGLARVRATSVSNSINKSVTANCPTGKVLLATGYSIDGGDGDVLIDYMAPTSTPGVIIQVSEEDAVSTNYTVSGVVICANASVAPVQASGSTDINPYDKSRTVTCPSGTSILSGGFVFQGQRATVVLDDMFQTTNKDAITFTGLGGDLGQFMGNWFLDAWAICAAT